MRSGFDTNILVSALISPGGPSDQLYQAWRDSRFSLITCEAQLEEFRRVTRYERVQRYFRPAKAGAMLNELRALAIMVSDLPNVTASSDPADNFLLAMASAGDADYLVSGDRRGVLSLGRFGRTQLVTLRQFLEILGL